MTDKDKDKSKSEPDRDGNIFERMNYPIGVRDDGTLVTEENMSWYRDENGDIVFKSDRHKNKEGRD